MSRPRTRKLRRAPRSSIEGTHPEFEPQNSARPSILFRLVGQFEPVQAADGITVLLAGAFGFVSGLCKRSHGGLSQRETTLLGISVTERGRTRSRPGSIHSVGSIPRRSFTA